MVIAYFMKHKRLSFHQAFNEVKSKRKIVIQLLTSDQSQWRLYQAFERLWSKAKIKSIDSFHNFAIAISNILKNAFGTVLQPKEGIQLLNKFLEGEDGKEPIVWL